MFHVYLRPDWQILNRVYTLPEHQQNGANLEHDTDDKSRLLAIAIVRHSKYSEFRIQMMLYSHNETIFCDALPELARVFEERKFSNSLKIYLSNLTFSTEKLTEPRILNDSSIEIDVAGIECRALAESCVAVTQKRMSQDEEMMFGVFGQEASKSTDCPPEVAALNARLILPRASEQYVSHFELRDFSIPPNPSLFSAVENLFSCSSHQIKLTQRHPKELFLHVDFEKERQTARSVMFEAVFLMWGHLKMKTSDQEEEEEEDVLQIARIVFPFVHFGKVRMCLEVDENGVGNVKMFNLFGSLFGVIDGIGRLEEVQDDAIFMSEKRLKLKFDGFSKRYSEEEEENPSRNLENSEAQGAAPVFEALKSIVENQMNLKVFTNSEVEEILNSSLPYLGIDSIRIAELEFHVASSPAFQHLKLKAPFLMRFKNLGQIVQFLESQLKTEKSHVDGAAESVKTSLDLNRKTDEFRIPLSSQQKRILFVMEMEDVTSSTSGTSSQFDESVFLRFSGKFDVHRVAAILNSLILRHTILRTSYYEDYQFLTSGTESFVSILPATTSESGVTNVRCIQKTDDVIQLIFHHISIDGRSLSIFYRDFERGFHNSSEAVLPIPRHLQYHDYCRSNDSLTSSEASESYWKNYLKSVEFEEIPTNFPREKMSSFEASRLLKAFPAGIQKKFDVFCNQNALSRFELFFGILQLTLAKVLGVDELTTGFAVDLRKFEHFETIGCFTNVLPYVFRRRKTEDVTEHLLEVQKTLHDSRSHAELPYERICKLGPAEFQVFVVSDVVEVSPEDVKRKKSVRFEDDVRIQVIQNSEDVKSIAKYEMTWYLRQYSDDALHIELEYAKELFKKTTMEFLLGDVFSTINAFDLLEPSRSATSSGISRRSDFPTSTVSQTISKMTIPPRIRHKEVNFDSQMNLKIDELSGSLSKLHLQVYGQLLAEHPVLLKIPRAPELIQAVLATWKAGFFPVPLHMDSTELAIRKTSEALGSRPLTLETGSSEGVLLLADGVPTSSARFRGRVFNRTSSLDMAYVTSTSGSTGTPKLVGTAFEGHSNLGRQYTTSFQLSSGDVICQTVDPSFDIFFADVVKTLLNNARLLLSRDSIPTPSELEQCSNAYLMPAFLSRLPSLSCLQNLQSLQFGGEPLPPQVIQRLLASHPNLRVWQEFGLTEQTVYSARSRIRRPADVRRIGEPYENLQISLKDAPRICLRGELVLSGVGLMRGYFGVKSSWRLKTLETGDVVHRDEKGEMMFIGRKDSQVKLRGFRIDLFEIECVALSSNLIDSCTCIVSPNSKDLVLFFKSPQNPQFPDQNLGEKLKMHLEMELVPFKIPRRLLELKTFPLTRTGKIDKLKLREMAENEESSETETLAIPAISPRTEILSGTIRKWLQRYSESEIASDDVDVFSCGVDSISVMLAVQKMRSEGVDIPVKTFFQQKTIRKVVEATLQCSASDSDLEGVVAQKCHVEVQKTSPKFFVDLNHIQQRILFLFRMTSSESPNLFRLNFRIRIVNGNFGKLGLATNTVILGNPLLRARIKRFSGDHRFILRSGTESYRHLIEKRQKTSSEDPFETIVWLENGALRISIHHVICDGRSLQILRNQLTQILEDGEDVEFQKSFELPPPKHLELELSNQSIFPAFKIGSKCSKLQFPCYYCKPADIPTTHHISHVFCEAVNATFRLPAFLLSTTFANRTTSNWNTVTMLANTIPIRYSESEDVRKFSERIREFSENSNVVVTRTADFAVNFHKALDEFQQDSSGFCQFPMLLTFSAAQKQAVLEFDERVVSTRNAEDVRDRMLEVLGIQTTSRKKIDIVKAFESVLKVRMTEDDDFFKSGGHSLTAMKLMDSLSDELEMELPLKLIFENPTPRQLKEAIEQLQTPGRQLEELKTAPARRFEYPLSGQQLQMFYLSQLTLDSQEYQLPFIQPFPRSQSVAEIHRSLLHTIQEQSIFRTTFRMTSSGEPVQEVVSMTESFLQCHVVSVESQSDLHQRIREMCAEPIEVLAATPLLRAAFVTSSEKCVAFLHLHHLISDARSTQLTNSTMRRFLENPEEPPKRLKFSYMDYCTSEGSMTCSVSEMDPNYIQSIVDGLRCISERSAETGRPRKVTIEVPQSLITRKLGGSKATPFSIFLAATSSVLQNSLSTSSFNIAFPILNRSEKTSGICGYFLNNLLINSRDLFNLSDVLHSNLRYSDVIREVRKASGRDVPVADVYINCRYDLEFDESDDDVLLDLIPLKLHFPVEIDVDLMGNVYRVTMRSNRFGELEMSKMLEKMLAELGAQQGSVSNTLFGARKDAPNSIPRLIEHFFTAQPTSPFALSPSEPTSYSQAWAQLRAYSCSISKGFVLSRAAPLRSDDVIAVVSSKSMSTTLKCLAVQYSGAAYLPIDEAYPEERKNEILKDATWILDDSPSETERRRHRHFSVATPESLAYIITTSGTTGKPKSVAIAGISVANLCVSSTLTMCISSSSRVFQFTNFVFDNSVLEVSMTIASQACLVYSEAGTSSFFDASRFESLITESGVTHSLLFPSLVQSFSTSRIRQLAYWIVGGERLQQRLLDEALDVGCHVIQNYGPTETTAFAVARRMRKGDRGAQIGLPAVNVKVRILNPEAEEGELLIAGVGRMRGYLNRTPDDTFRRLDDEMWYSSGDVCRMTSDGVEFVGRTDSQIKIRGYRVELSEIERTIESLRSPHVVRCIALFDSENQQIHVFYTGNATSSGSGDVRKHCERHLEAHKIPSSFTWIREFPLTNNSKIDKPKLLEMRLRSNDWVTASGAEAEDVTSSELSAIWMELLHCPTPSDSDHFFLVGGHSLLLIRLRHLIQHRMHVELSVPEILENLKFGDMRRLLFQKKSAAKSLKSELENTKPRLIFFPALYGGCTGYLKLVSLLRTSSDFEIILLDEVPDGDTVDDVALGYRQQIRQKLEGKSIQKSFFVGASSAGAFAVATWQKCNSDDVEVILLDSGTFWDRIEKLKFEEHQKDIIQNLWNNFQIDPEIGNELAKSSWKTLQVLKNYRPNYCGAILHTLAVDGSDLGWSKFSKNTKVYEINGDHYTMLQEFAHDVARTIRTIALRR